MPQDDEYEPGVYLHVHDGSDPNCPSCQMIVLAREGETGDHPQASDQAKQPPMWGTVTDPYARQEHTFESAALALVAAAEMARSDRPTVVMPPTGKAAVVVMLVDERVTLQAVRHLSGPPVDEQAPVRMSPDSSLQALAGARLFYALYHDAEAVRWLTGGRPKDDAARGKVTAFNKAYMSAQAAFLPPELRRGLVDDEPAEHERPDLVEAYRKGRQDEAEAIAKGPGVPLGAAMSLVQQGRREAAEAIRQQARYFGAEGKSEGEQGTMLSFEVAAQLAEGTTGVTGT